MNNDYRGLAYQDYSPISNKVFGPKVKNKKQRYSKTPQHLFSRYITNDNVSILELGCGNGDLLRCLMSTGKLRHAIGVDISLKKDESIKVSNDKEILLKSSSIEEALHKYSSFRFDYILAIDVLEHFSFDELFNIIPKIKKCLNSNGKLIIRVPNMNSPLCSPIAYGDITHISFFTPSSIKQLLYLHSFDDVKVHAEPAFSKFKIIFFLRKIIGLVLEISMFILYALVVGRRVSIFTPNLIAIAGHSTNSNTT